MGGTLLRLVCSRMVLYQLIQREMARGASARVAYTTKVLSPVRYHADPGRRECHRSAVWPRSPEQARGPSGARDAPVDDTSAGRAEGPGGHSHAVSAGAEIAALPDERVPLQTETRPSPWPINGGCCIDPQQRPTSVRTAWRLGRPAPAPTGMMEQGLMSHTLVRLGRPTLGGRGVLARTDLTADVVVEVAPVLLLHRADGEHAGSLARYVFEWDDDRDETAYAMALGLGAMFNHSGNPPAGTSVPTTTRSSPDSSAGQRHRVTSLHRRSCS